MPLTIVSLNPRELGAILAALRFYQRAMTKNEGEPPNIDIATNCGEHDWLEADEIDTLCERINR